MFNGIITAIGTIIAASNGIFTIKTSLSSQVIIGSSVACSGVCLTVIEVINNSIVVEVSQATFSCTNLALWQVDTHINLELSMQIGARMDGHFVLGHVDTLVQITELNLLPDGCYKITLQAPYEWMKYIAYKGSVALDGTSLTINEVSDNIFSINILPYTFNNTTFKDNTVGDKLNMEIDVLARYTEKMLAYGSISKH